MKKIGALTLMLAILITTVTVCKATGPPEERVRIAYQMLLQETDTNRDGMIAIAECQAIYKDPAMADKNCKFWDANNDGAIMEDEYVGQVMSIGKKK